MAVHKATLKFPRQEQFGLVMQVRRAATSAAANIVEGCARETSADLAKFMAIAYASAREAEYQIDVSIRLGYVSDELAAYLRHQASRSSFLLARLASQARRFRAMDARRARS
jgi:four helix bundle protein